MTWSLGVPYTNPSKSVKRFLEISQISCGRGETRTHEARTGSGYKPDCFHQLAYPSARTISLLGKGVKPGMLPLGCVLRNVVAVSQGDLVVALDLILAKHVVSHKVVELSVPPVLADRTESCA